jgi:aspartyl protease family protein
LLTIGLLLTLPERVLAQPSEQAQVSLSGVLGSRALLIVNGTPPKLVGVGENHMGVKVVAVARDQATLDVNGQRLTLRLGDAPSSVGGGAQPVNTSRIVLTAESGGHFIANGSINGKVARFMVDTGATSVTLGLPDAQRIGLNLTAAPPIRLSTANGVVQGWRLKLDSVRVGDAQVYAVDAVVLPEPLPFVLLGNSFLSRFQMQRTNDQLTLDRRF